MARNFEELRAKMSPERRARNKAESRKMLAELALQDLRQSVSLTQTQVAAVLSVNQAAISKMESQDDMYVSTLQRYVEALGGKLELVATFPDRKVSINQFC